MYSTLIMTKDEILQIKIILDGIKPKIWRRFQVESNITFHRLHNVIQIVMGWSDSHLYGFKVDGKEYQNEKSVDFSYDDGILGAGKQKISMLALKQKFWYMYDFGDGWEHLLVVEKILPKDKSAFYPFCVEGERNCPPEDCGSYQGYYHLLNVRNNKKHPEYNELIKEWLGEGYDPEHFDVEAVNLELGQQFPKKEKNPDGRARYWMMRTEK